MSVAPSRVGSRMQQYEDGVNDEEHATADGAMAAPGVGGGEDVAPATPRHDKPANSLSAPLALVGNGAHHESDDDDAEDDPPNPVNGGYWRQGASRAASPAMGDNASDSSMIPPARPKSRVEMTTSRYNNLSYWKARRVLFYKNGDPFFPGIEFRFKPGRDIVSLESLLDKLSLRMDLPRGARYIFSMDGDRKYRLDELEDGASYVVSSYKTFKVSLRMLSTLLFF
ncbi:Echinoderm microtubule-associated protein-like CG42247 [Tribolium castaneum]|uniref:Echinoderm microtubule-associated protein-like CG42247 n=1 Tax=Tribolium castaneum TaxID=7070 RepID=D6X2P2_TRICA|nr:Echinoderm microtubule-associated protein-like CG42247 [Tribolium castaneum]